MIDRRGFFLSFEGTEGCGKTSQMLLLVERLQKLGFDVVQNQEPGATRIGTQIRRVLLDPAHQEMNAMTELLLMFASRTQAAAEIIRPALQRGDIVVSDRFTDSTLAYQGYARGLGFDTVRKAHQLALDSLLPDLTLIISVDLQTGLARAHRRLEHDTSEARLDLQSLDFHRRVSEGYRLLAESEPDRVRIVDGSGTLEAVAERVWAEVSPVLPHIARVGS